MSDSEDKTFWEHLDDLRGLLVHVVVVSGVAIVACFCFKDELFDVVLAPSHPDFLLYRLLSGLAAPNLPAGLVNTSLAGQLMAHFKVAILAGVVVSAPVVVWLVGRYLAPALYPAEKRAMRLIFLWGGLLFFLGIAVAYLLVFPLAYQFMASYVVSDEVANMFTLDSYIDNMLLLLLLMGVLFEMPVMAMLLGRAGIVSARLMRKYRRHALLAIVTAAAVITPTTDVFTLVIVSLPICVLYEVSIHLVK